MDKLRKVIVIGLDGLEPAIAEPLLDAGELPHLARLRQKGGYARIATTYPAQTPVAWSTFATGTNPGKHGIFDFVRRNPQTYLPDFSLNRYEQKSPYLPPKAVNLRRGTTIWDLLSSAGLPSAIIRCPCTFPPDKIRGRMLSGMGVPDLRGGLGTGTFYSAATGIQAQESENVVPLPANGNAVRTHIIGPRQPGTGTDLRFEITFHLEPAANRLVVRSEGQPKVLAVQQGEWSDWLRVKFKAGLLQRVRGMVRFYLARLEPVVELYASPVNFDPDAPLFPISSPPEYARELAAKVGTFYTTGMVEEHNGLNNGRISESAYLDQCARVLRERERMLRHELARLEEGLLFCLFDTPDRVQHMFWREREPGRQREGGTPRPAGAAGVIEQHYRDCDALLGRALEAAGDQALFIVLSDHGMNSFRRGVHLNTWLRDAGLLALRSGVKPGEEAGDFFRNVDWEKTQAYALGLSGIYLNRKGREDRGIVDTGEAESLKAAIIKGLTALGDPTLGSAAIRSVLPREQVYAGEFTDDAPDLLVNFAAGYRVSWATALGGVPAGHFEDNTRKWAGDHIVDPSLVPGVLFMNRPFRTARAALLDMAPTILQALGIPRGPAMEGEALLA